MLFPDLSCASAFFLNTQQSIRKAPKPLNDLSHEGLLQSTEVPGELGTPSDEGQANQQQNKHQTIANFHLTKKDTGKPRNSQDMHSLHFVNDTEA